MRLRPRIQLVMAIVVIVVVVVSLPSYWLSVGTLEQIGSAPLRPRLTPSAPGNPSTGLAGPGAGTRYRPSSTGHIRATSEMPSSCFGLTRVPVAAKQQPAWSRDVDFPKRQGANAFCFGSSTASASPPFSKRLLAAWLSLPSRNRQERDPLPAAEVFANSAAMPAAAAIAATGPD